MNTEKIFVTKSSMPPLEEYVEEIRPLWESHWLTNMGAKHKELENRLKEYLNVDNIALYVNGHTALEGIIEAMNLGSDGRKKVITTPFTFASTAHAIVRKGLVPVFADIKPNDCTIDPKSIEDHMSEDVCAILPVHVYGNLCDIDAIDVIAKNNNLKVIYDAAHAFGVMKDGISAANFGDASMLSFHATKAFNTIEGGAVCFHDKDLGHVLNQWKNFGITGPETVEYIGGNAKMNEFAAAMGLCNLRHIDEEIDKRKTIAHQYYSLLDSIEGIETIMPDESIKPNYAYMPIRISERYKYNRDELHEKLKEEQIFTRKYFYPLVSDYECYSSRYCSSDTPVAKSIASEILTLPLYADLKKDTVNKICSIINSLNQ